MPAPALHRVRVVDSHTGGEPTRVVIEGGPDLGTGPLAERRDRFRREADPFRSAIVNEPRGSDVLVGALLTPPHDPSCQAGVIFFNNVGCLGMCGHGTLGLVVTLAHLGRLQPGPLRLDTPVGPVTTTLHPNGEVSLENVPSYRAHAAVTVPVPGLGPVTGDVAWGGNWFFLIKDHGLNLSLAELDRLTDYTWRVRQAVNQAGYPEIDHIELFGPPQTPGAHARNFVLCPGRAYDRSPCGTGTSAKLACLAADHAWPPQTPWVQEGILGTRFVGHYRWADPRILPTLTGTAFVTGETTLWLDERDPFCWGIRP